MLRVRTDGQRQDARKSTTRLVRALHSKGANIMTRRRAANLAS